MEGVTGDKLVRDQQIVTGLNRAIADFIARLNRGGMSPDSAQRLPNILRIVRYYETLAELALEAAAATRETRTPILGEPADFAASTESLLERIDPEMKLDDTSIVESGLQHMEDNYQSLKAWLLEAGAHGHMPVPEMDARLRAASATRRAMQQAVKAVLLLNDETSEDDMEKLSASAG
jgi:phosphate:Na+ symporter